MYDLQNLRMDIVLRESAPTNGETVTSDAIDTLGYDSCLIIVQGTTSNNATNNPSVLKITESDDATTYSAITALTGDGAGGFTIPNSPTATTTKPFAVFNIDTRYRKRYLLVTITPVTTQTFNVIAIQGRGAQAPVGTTAQNAACVVTA